MNSFYTLLLSTALFCLYSCSFKTTEDLDQASLELAKRSLNFVKTNQIDSFKTTLDTRILNTTDEQILLDFIERAKPILSKSAFPTDSLIAGFTQYTKKGKKVYKFSKVSFPFKKNDHDTLKHINFVIQEDKIVGLNIASQAFLLIETPHNKSPHLDKHQLNVNDISWFRIWYGSGFKENKYGDSYGYYAVEGGQAKLNKCGNKVILEELFNLINDAPIDSMDHSSSLNNYIGKPEFLLLRFKFDSELYKDLGEVKIRFVLEESPNQAESRVNANYILIFHSGKTRYLIDKSKNRALIEKLKELAYIDYGWCQEFRMH